MALSRQRFAAKQKRPGNRFFASVIFLGLAILAGIWLKESVSKNPTPKKIEASKAQVLPQPKTNAPQTVSVLVMTKTNVVPEKLTNTVISQTKTQAAPTIIVAPQIERRADGFTPRPVQNVLEAQVTLARMGISPGSIDGIIGSQTRAAIRAFQQKEHLPATGELDSLTAARLLLSEPLYTKFFLTPGDLARLQPLGTNWWSKSRQTRLDYETVLEMVSEKTCCHPNFVKRLNPSCNWTNASAPMVLQVVAIESPKAEYGAAFVRIRLTEKILEAFDAETNLLAHFPCSIARRVEKRPIGELHVKNIAENPDYTFDPQNFPESPEARRMNTRLILSPGPNNPVGTVWIGLDKPGYGIHGTPNPEAVGRTESHGCFRLANWNAEYLARLVSIGTPVFVEP